MGTMVATGPADALGNLPESVPADRTALADGMEGWMAPLPGLEAS